jgi:hypothetical protein
MGSGSPMRGGWAPESVQRSGKACARSTSSLHCFSRFSSCCMHALFTVKKSSFLMSSPCVEASVKKGSKPLHPHTTLIHNTLVWINSELLALGISCRHPERECGAAKASTASLNSTCDTSGAVGCCWCHARSALHAAPQKPHVLRKISGGFGMVRVTPTKSTKTR